MRFRGVGTPEARAPREHTGSCVQQCGVRVRRQSDAAITRHDFYDTRFDTIGDEQQTPIAFGDRLATHPRFESSRLLRKDPGTGYRAAKYSSMTVEES